MPFKIRVSDAVLSDLKQRLTRARFADEIPGVEWDYGTNLAYLKTLVAYWRDNYDWRAQERRLNEFEQFKTNIDGLDIHFIHRRSKIPGAAPLLLLNGWPSSIEEYAKVIGPLTDPAAHGGQAADAFDVVIPSMPGYGFSDKPRERGYNPERMAEVWVKLMARLGYARYITHGSDWGIAVASLPGAERQRAHDGAAPGGLSGRRHAARAAPPPQASTPAPVSANLGYQEIQTTKPQTLGQGSERLADRAGVVDHRQVAVVERPRRRPREGLHERRTADEHHDLLGDQLRDLVGPPLLREPACGRPPAADLLRRISPAPAPGTGDRADRMRRVSLAVRSPRHPPELRHRGGAAIGRGALQRHAPDDLTARRPLPGARTATGLARRSPGVHAPARTLTLGLAKRRHVERRTSRVDTSDGARQNADAERLNVEPSNAER